VANEELKPLVTVVSFLALFAILAGTIPAQFYAASYEGVELNVPSDFEGIDIQSFAETWPYTLNETGGDTTIYGLYRVFDVGGADFGGHDLDLVYRRANESDKFVSIEHFWTEWWFFRYGHPMSWYNRQMIDKTTSFHGGLYEGLALDDLENDTIQGSAEYTVKCDHLQLKAFLGYNTTLYANVTDAWDHHGLHIMLGINFDQLNTAINAWNIVGMILLFQTPDVHPVLNAIIAIPLWLCIAYLAYVLILKAIPFVGG